MNVPSSLIPVITKLISAEPDGMMADIACSRGLVLERSLMEDTGLSGEAVDINSRNIHFAEMLLSPKTVPLDVRHAVCYNERQVADDRVCAACAHIL